MEGSENKRKKRLVFDRRYGWVYDEWKEPSEEALSGGRGLFCIAPLVKGFVNPAWHSIDAASTSVIRIIERPELLSPQQLQASLGEELSRLMTHLRQPKIKLQFPTIASFGFGFGLGSESNADCSKSQGSISS